MLTLVCPTCGSDDTRSVPLLYQQGTSVSGGVSIYVGTHGNRGVIPSVGRTTTLAASNLAPPPPRDATGAVLWGGFLGAVAGGLIAQLVIWIFDMSEADTLIGIAAILCAVIGGISAYTKYEAHESEWQAAASRWQSSFQCQRCGHLFVPGQTSENVQRYQNLEDIVRQQCPR